MGEVILCDVQCGCLGVAPGTRTAISAETLVEEMRRLTIAKALIRILPEGLDSDPAGSAKRLQHICKIFPQLIPCPSVTARNGSEKPDDVDQVEHAVSLGAGAVCIRPALDGWIPDEWASDSLFKALDERRMPVLCAERLVSLPVIAALAQRYPRLPLIAAEVGYRSQAIILPLLKKFPNVYLSIGNNYIVHSGLEQLVAAVGPERLLFGTGFPTSEPMAAITMLMYAALSDGDKQSIGSGNFFRLMGGIMR